MASSRLDVIVGAAILNFDITSGDCVERKLGTLGAVADDRLSALAIPEGSHTVPEDTTYFLTTTTADRTPQPLFGLSCFINRRDPSAPRGAYMKALLVLIRKPYFSFLTPILRAALAKYLDSGSTDATILPMIVTRINALGASTGAQRPDSLTLFAEPPQTFAVDMPSSYPADQFGLEKDAGLLRLVQRFREDTMVIWWALLLQTRVLFCGQPAGAVGACVLACPMLVAPLTGFSEVLAPYVPLSHPEQVEDVKRGGRYVCGVTNGIFAQKAKWYDCLASLATGHVSGGILEPPSSEKDGGGGLRVRLSAKERSFIKNVLQAIERDGRGEAWVREQFRAFTDSFLVEVSIGAEQGRLGKAASSHRNQAEIWRLTSSSSFQSYLAAKPGEAELLAASEKKKGTERGAKEYYELLLLASSSATKGGAAAPAPAASEVPKLLFNLHSTLSNLGEIDELVGLGAVQALSSKAFLGSDSSQVRKYAAGVLATLSSTVKGQVAVLSSGLLPIFVSMLQTDAMPAVCAAAASCLHRTASLYVGAQALVAADIVRPLTRLLLEPPTEELVLRTLLASTLLRVYRFLPTAPRLDGAEGWVLAVLVDTHAGLTRALAQGGPSSSSSPSFLSGLLKLIDDDSAQSHGLLACRVLEVMAQHSAGAKALVASRPAMASLVARALRDAEAEPEAAALGGGLAVLHQLLRTLQREGVTPPAEVRKALLPLSKLGAAPKMTRASSAMGSGGAGTREAALESVLRVVQVG